jgi:hypothetical protein
VRSLAASSTPGQIVVSWRQPTWKPPKGSSYIYEVRLMDPAGKPVVRSTGGLTATFDGLAFGRQYTIEVRAQWSEAHPRERSKFSIGKRVVATVSMPLPTPGPPPVLSRPVIPPYCGWTTINGMRWHFCVPSG